MFYKMITNARNRWLPSCTVRDLISYMEKRGQLRDAQIDAIQTWLFLKIGCGCRPLPELFISGKFNTLDLEDEALPSPVRGCLASHPAAAALYEYARLTREGNRQSPLEQRLSTAPESVDCTGFFRDAFYGVSYTDYLFSLPMGAGKTWLMAAFIYLDLYFAQNEMDNPAFAHNFIILAPSGLKSSVVPSLRTIRDFNPAWVIPEPAASNLRRNLVFEVLDQCRTAKKGNQTKNPNVQKISNQIRPNGPFGLVAVINAEKVILDRVEDQDGLISFFEDSGDERDRQANELRNLIGKLPALSVFIDEVHHAVSSEIKLRAVVNRWAENGTFNSVVGFSGTPYLEKAEKIPLSDGLSVSTAEIANIVYYYPLLDGVGNFLKRPEILIEEMADSDRIIENGVRLFLDRYRDTVYGGGTAAKLGIYCGTIEKLERVYLMVSEIAGQYGLSGGAVLRFHKGNKRYPQPRDSQMEYDSLDKPSSKVRIVLLVQIGKEGWDCRSLTGIILSQEGDCPRNMVLQTSCRCLRQVDRGAPETALIYLNSANAKKLEQQLKQQHHISLRQFSEKQPEDSVMLKCYDRTGVLDLPPLPFYQFHVQYDTFLTEPPNAGRGLSAAAGEARVDIRRSTDLEMDHYSTEINDTEEGKEPAAFSSWLYAVSRGGFGTPSMPQLNEWRKELRTVFDTITYEQDGSRYYNARFDRAAVEASVRRAFCEKRDFVTREERIPESAKLLNIANFKSEVPAETPEDYYPDQSEVEKIVRADRGRLGDDPKTRQIRELAKETGNQELLAFLNSQSHLHPGWNRSFHYLPYHTDSRFEQRFLREILSYTNLERLGLEAYYNGDDTLTDFKIRCFQRHKKRWRYIGRYVPDFLVIQRRDGAIYKALIVETKGAGFASEPGFQEKRRFTEEEFIRMNNEQAGYPRFEYLYLEDSMKEHDRIQVVQKKIRKFFGEA